MKITVQLSVWYQHIRTDTILSYVQELLDDHGFTRLTPMASEFHSWDIVRYRGKNVWCAVTTSTEDHVVFELKLKGEHTELLPLVVPIFLKVIESRQPLVNECILADANPDVYPFFTHSFYRGAAPIPVDVLGDELKESCTYTYEDENYWDELGHMLHFVAHHLFTHLDIPSPQEWSDRIRVRVVEALNGHVFDCGWSRAWPDYIPSKLTR